MNTTVFNNSADFNMWSSPYPFRDNHQHTLGPNGSQYFKCNTTYFMVFKFSIFQKMTTVKSS